MRVLQRLPLRLGSHCAGEPAYSVFDRLGARSGTSARDLARDYGLEERSIRRGKLVETVAALADVDAADLRAATLISNARKAELNGTIMERWLWDLSRRVHCPVCVREDGERQPELAYAGVVRRVWWDCKVVHACPVHGARLEKLRMESSKDQGNVLRLDDSGEQAVDVSWEIYLVGRFGFGPKPVSDVLDGMDIDAAIISVALFGWVSRFGKFKKFDFLSSFEDPETIGAGYKILKNSDRLSLFLDSLWIEDKNYYKHAKCTSIYGELYRWYYSNSTAPNAGNRSSFALIRERIREHALSRLPLGDNPKIFGELYSGRGLLPMPGCTDARRAGDHAFFRTAVGLGLIDPSLAEVEWKKIGVSRKAIEQVRSFREATISARELAIRISAPWSIISDLIRSDYLVPDMVVGQGFGKTFLFRSEIAAELLDRLAGTASLASLPVAGSATITEAAATCGIHRSKLIRALFDGRISASGRLGRIDGFPGILVRLDDVEALASAEAEEQLVPLKEAGLRIGVNANTVRSLARQRIVRTSSIGRSSKRGSYWLAVSEIDRFEATYVIGTVLAPVLGIGQRDLALLLERYGIDTAVSRREFPFLLIRRSDLVAAGLLPTGSETA